MKEVMHSKKHWAPGSGVKILRVARTDGYGWNVYAAVPEKGTCPDCGIRSSRRHGWRHRRLLDYPSHGEAVVIQLRIGRWRCTVQHCSRRTFSDEASAN
ncbi:MAG: transposase [Mesorhizobium sp.]|uniref:transposase family protein n=1 Tax=Mesorhizobium sp. TaxID=1871066 RepID=UPI000FE9C976|nr:MAG: transposase [Mesorhizobium sp.]